MNKKIVQAIACLSFLLFSVQLVIAETPSSNCNFMNSVDAELQDAGVNITWSVYLGTCPTPSGFYIYKQYKYEEHPEIEVPKPWNLYYGKISQHLLKADEK